MHEGFAPLQPPNANPVRWRRLRRLTEGNSSDAAGTAGYWIGREKRGERAGAAGGRWPPVPGALPSQTVQVAGREENKNGGAG